MKKGQIQLSFGVIFSIIIIIAVLGVSSYVIVKILNTGSSIECQLYYQDIQKKIDEAWGSNGEVSYKFESSIGSKTQKVCFGNFSQTILNADDKTAYDEMRDYIHPENNLVFYPISSCGDGKFAFTMKHVKTEGFFCIERQAGKAGVNLLKSRFESLVRLSA